jgi:predicted PhzF superfamily epimerase YddE/YHI9
MIAARIANLQVGSNQHVSRVKDPETGEVVGIPTGSKTDLAKVVNVSRDSIVQAAKVASTGTPALVAAVTSGEVAVNAAAEVAKLP